MKSIKSLFKRILARDSDESNSWKVIQAETLLKKYSVAEIKKYVEIYGSPIYILSTSTIQTQYRLLKHHLPRVNHYYAIKCMPHEEIIRTIKNLGGYFDIATNGEVDLVKNFGVDPNRTIHTHPIKQTTDIKYALAYGTNTFVFDNEDELKKHIQFKDSIKILIRISFPNKAAKADLSSKFGVHKDHAMVLLRRAVDMGYAVDGLSLHVGSQVPNPAKHIEAIEFCSQLIDRAKKQNISLNVLDIGGGFPVEYATPTMSFQDFIRPIADVLDRLIPKNIQIISEPGRFIAGPSMHLITRVIGKTVRHGKKYYYLDDGVYGGYTGKVFDQGEYLIYSLRELENPSVIKYMSTLAGPTCDSLDLISRGIMLPELVYGDILISPMMGAYSAAHATTFNFIPKAKIILEEELR